MQFKLLSRAAVSHKKNGDKDKREQQQSEQTQKPQRYNLAAVIKISV
jgi:hypothetical protein